MYIGFASPSLEMPAISDYLTRVVQPILATVEGVASADVIGGQTFAMRVWLDPARMAARGISATDVALAIRANNYQTAPGQQKGYFTIANITANTDLQSVDQFREMVVKANEGALIRLKRHRDHIARRAKFRRRRLHGRPERGVHRRAANAGRQPADDGERGAQEA